MSVAKYSYSKIFRNKLLKRKLFSVLTDVKSETWFIIGAVQIVISIQSLQYFGMPLLHLNRKGESNTIHLVLSSISGGSFLIFFAIGRLMF